MCLLVHQVVCAKIVVVYSKRGCNIGKLEVNNVGVLRWDLHVFVLILIINSRDTASGR